MSARFHALVSALLLFSQDAFATKLLQEDVPLIESHRLSQTTELQWGAGCSTQISPAAGPASFEAAAHHVAGGTVVLLERPGVSGRRVEALGIAHAGSVGPPVAVADGPLLVSALLRDDTILLMSGSVGAPLLTTLAARVRVPGEVIDVFRTRQTVLIEPAAAPTSERIFGSAAVVTVNSGWFLFADERLLDAWRVRRLVEADSGPMSSFDVVAEGRLLGSERLGPDSAVVATLRRRRVEVTVHTLATVYPDVPIDVFRSRSERVGDLLAMVPLAVSTQRRRDVIVTLADDGWSIGVTLLGRDTQWVPLPTRLGPSDVPHVSTSPAGARLTWRRPDGTRWTAELSPSGDVDSGLEVVRCERRDAKRGEQEYKDERR